MIIFVLWWKILEDIISNKMIRDERFLKSLKKGLSNGARRLIVNYWNGID